MLCKNLSYISTVASPLEALIIVGNKVPKDDIRNLLIEALSKSKKDEESPSSPEEPQVNLHELIQEAQEISIVRKDNVFKEEITEDDQKIIQQRVAAQRKQYLFSLFSLLICLLLQIYGIRET